MAEQELDFDNLSDEDFLQISEEDANNAIQSQKPTEDHTHENNVQEPVIEEDDDDAETGVDDDTSTDGGESHGSGPDPLSGSGQEAPDSEAETNPDTSGTGEADEDPTGETETKEGEEGEKPQAAEVKLPEGITPEQVTEALDFHKILTTPFKADGKDFTVRSAEDAIRFIQQGVNYSRRMNELKPMKAMNRLLTDHGLNDPEKISFLIDISNGDKAAIAKLLKEKNMDPMDLDVSEENNYQVKSYGGNAKVNAFRDALDYAVTIPEGQALVSEIHNSWDDQSKAKLRENPEILGNLVELRQSGIYQKIADELQYQRAMGYLTQVPYLQAFDQVGEAMKNAGVLNQQQPQPAPAAVPLGQLQSNTQKQGQPVASGARKAQAPKKAQPNPHLSSTPPSKQTGNTSQEIDFDKLSDEEFLKMAPPS
jgi:hypothetical protein